jgi:predicted PurR-regulated permease PerM
MKQEHIILKEKIYRWTIFIAALIIVIAGTLEAQSFITIFLLSAFVSIISVHPVQWLDKKKVPHGLSVMIVLLGIILIISGLSGIVGGSISSFTSHLGNYENRLKEISQSINSTLKNYGIELSMDHLTNMFDPAKVLDYTASTLSQLGNLMSNMALIFFIVMFVLLEMNSISLKANLFGIVTKKRKTVSSLSRIESSIRHYLVIKTLISLLTGIMIGIWLWILGIEYPILWALIAFLLNYIPNIGSIIAAIPTLLFAWIQKDFAMSIWVLSGYVFTNMLIGYYIEPRVMGRGMGLSTLVVFLSLIIWGYLLGLVGMFLSVPLTMILKIILENSDETKAFAAILGTDKDAEKLLKKR